jgi:hypothetical protein
MLETDIPGSLLNMSPLSVTSNYIVIVSTEIRTELLPKYAYLVTSVRSEVLTASAVKTSLFGV